MKRIVSVESALYFTKLSVYLAFTWPPSINATKWENVKNDIAILSSYLSILCLLIPVLALSTVYKVDSVTLTERILCISCSCNYIIKTHVYKILTHEMEDFVKKPRSHEKAILQCYVDRCWMFHVFVTLTLVLPVIGQSVIPLITDQLLPMKAFYPFAVDPNFTVYYVIYVHQILACLQLVTGLVFIDCQAAVLMWYASARLEILVGEFKSVSNMTEFRSIIQKHQRILAYSIEVADTMSYIAFVTTMSSGLGVILCCIQMINKNLPLSTKMNYALGILMYMTNLFICTWPAENLLHVCDLMASTVYNAPWMDVSPIWRKNCLAVLQRSHRPVKVSVAGFIPTLSFNFYGSFLSAVFSYFTTLRSVTSLDSEN